MDKLTEILGREAKKEKKAGQKKKEALQEDDSHGENLSNLITLLVNKDRESKEKMNHGVNNNLNVALPRNDSGLGGLRSESKLAGGDTASRSHRKNKLRDNNSVEEASVASTRRSRKTR